jgi:hypothetical protein
MIECMLHNLMRLVTAGFARGRSQQHFFAVFCVGEVSIQIFVVSVKSF